MSSSLSAEDWRHDISGRDPIQGSPSAQLYYNEALCILFIFFCMIGTSPRTKKPHRHVALFMRRLDSAWFRQSFDEGSARAAGGVRDSIMIPLGAYIGWCEGYDMECIHRIQELCA